MRWSSIPLSILLGSTICLSACTGCTQQQTPDQIRHATANATAKLKQDTVAVAKGIKDGMTKPNAVDINTASRSDLASTLKITDAQADRIIAARPYDNTDQLVTKRAMTTTEYDRVKDRVSVKK